jgi:hypothetical protein|tara:strand:+ start:3205 stop:4905 length:1701 start_codon:yes stop_codon:yes gene_type:complete
MARGPAEVSFPGDKNRRKKVKVRGIKKASKQIQQRLEKDLDALLENPHIFLPKINVDLGRSRRDMMAASLKEIDYVATKRHNRRWLAKRMVKRRGCVVSRSLAGSLLAALDGDLSTVSVFNNPVYGSSSFIRRGNGKQSHQAGIQNFNHHKLRLLVWDDHAKSGHWYFSWKNGFEYTGMSPLAPDDWIDAALENASIKFTGNQIKWSKGLDEETVTNNVFTDTGWLKITFQNGVVAGLSQSSLAKPEEAFIPSIALTMLPPKISEIVKAEWIWRPAGWPEDKPLPPKGLEKLDEIILAWMSMAIEDSILARECRTSILNSIDDGFVTGANWFDEDSKEEFLQYLSGSDNERAAISVILDSLESGIHVRQDGLTFELEDNVVRFEESSCHPVLVSLWEEHGMLVLKEMFALEGVECEQIYRRQLQRKQGFGAFLRELGSNLSTAKKLDLLPWKTDDLPVPLNFADKLIRKAGDDGIASTVSMARKGRGLESAMGWAWLVVHERTESDAWRFDSSSRDKGSDWVPALKMLWNSAEKILIENKKEAKKEYIVAMKKLAEISGAGKLSEP